MKERANIGLKPIKVVLIILMAAAVATFGLLEGGGVTPEAVAEHPIEEHFDPLMPRYPRVSEFPLGEVLEVGEGDMRMSYFATKDPPLRVARFYQTMWEQEGLKVHSHVTPVGGVVGTYDPRLKGSRSVTLFTKNRLTWAFPSTIDRPMGTAHEGDLGAREGVPVYPGSSRGLTLRTTDSGRGSMVATYSNDGGLTKNLQFYRSEMLTRGWTEQEMQSFDELEGHRTLSFGRDNQRCTINLTPTKRDQNVIVSVMVERGYDE